MNNERMNVPHLLNVNNEQSTNERAPLIGQSHQGSRSGIDRWMDVGKTGASFTLLLSKCSISDGLSVLVLIFGLFLGQCFMCSLSQAQ